jgi:hypothetical protein
MRGVHTEGLTLKGYSPSPILSPSQTYLRSNEKYKPV